MQMALFWFIFHKPINNLFFCIFQKNNITIKSKNQQK